MRRKYSDSQLIYSTSDYSFFVALARFSPCVSVYVYNMYILCSTCEKWCSLLSDGGSVCYEFSFFCASYTIFLRFILVTHHSVLFSSYIYIEWRIKWRIYYLLLLISSIFLQFFDRTKGKIFYFFIYCIRHWFPTTNKTTNRNRVNKNYSADTDANYKTTHWCFLKR